MIRTVIIDDKPAVREAIAVLLKKLCPDVEVVGHAGSVESGGKLIRETKPELVFLDIQMPGGSGFNILQQFDDIDFKVIFVTAFDQFAMDALKYSAVDYLLKPVNSEELVVAVNKFKRDRNTRDDIRSLLEHLRVGADDKRLVVVSTGMMEYIDVDDIVRCEAEGAYTGIYLIGGRKILSSKPIKGYDDQLSGRGFYRIHRSHLINLSHVRKHKKGDRDVVTMADGSAVEFYRSKRKEFLEVMKDRSL